MSTMKAVICTRYGGPEVLQLADVPKPHAKKDEILVRIRATAVNSGDVRVRGLQVEGLMKVIMRLVLGVRKPRKPILGTVFSGIVESIGQDVSNFNPCDEVFGMTGFQFGTYAEYIAVKAKGNVLPKPQNATFEEAAALPFGGQTAIYFLEKAKLPAKAHPEVLIYGATGSVGTAAVQLAKYYGAKVTAVCSSSGADLASRLGADRVVTYDTQNFTQLPQQFDLFLDAVGKTKKHSVEHLLKPKGLYLSVAGLDYASENIAQLELLKELFEHHGYDATIDRTYPMQEIVAAHQYVDTGHKKGNVVLQV
ncbi:NAD(P)-dependent alcohol dehydrogenase [Lunatimonas lonarensis]|nr:NAD(P)-dependent alcohol dehydrogenase [Lunatimonas lonarensis]